MTEKDYAETLFQAMNVLIDKKIETVKFDETIVATIVDASKAESGQYIVSTGNAKFIAYSTETRYKENTAVMVTIPQGNYDNQKMIIGKAVDNANTPMIYKSPLQSLINVSNNLISKDVGITSFWANSEDAYLGRYWNIGQSSFKDATVYIGDESEEPSITYIWDSGEIFEQGFTRLGLQAQFSTWLNEYDTITGNYGLAVELTFKCLDLEENNTFTNIFTFDSNEFFGDVYNFETYYTQENLYDISDFKDYPIVRIRLFPYQRGNFKDTLGEFIPTIDTDDFSTIGPNIFIKDPYICLGMSIEDFSGDSVTLITDSSLTYSKKIKENEEVEDEDSTNTKIIDRDSANTKIIGARWIHKDLDTDVITTIQENEIPTGYEVRWYRYKLGVHSPDQFAGAHWERFYGSGTRDDLNETTWEYALSEENDIATNNLEVIFIPNINNQTEQIKVIIIKNESATIQKLVAASDILTFTNVDDVRNEATLIDANALSIRFEDDEKGNYFLYNRAGDIGKEEYGEVRVLTAVFDEQEHNINKKAKLNIRECSSIIWTFPDQNANTMIIPMDGIGPDAQPKKAADGQFIFNNVQQVGYTIKRHLNNNANQNTVRLDIIKDGLRYSAQIQMLFGTAGTSGSDYTLFIEWENGQNAFNVSPGFSHELSGYIHLMDASGQLIEIPNESQIEASWSAVSYSGLTMGTEKQTITVNEELFYPINNNALQPISNGGRINSEDYLVNSSSGVTYYEYNVIQKNFRSTSYDSNKILYRKVAGKKKLEFQPVLTEYIPDDNRNGTIQTINSQRVYFYDKKKRLFIKYNDIFIIDPWDEYQEVETYYEPIVTEDVKYLNNASLKYLVTKEENNNWKISLTGDNVNINSLYILQITLTNFGDYDLVAYYPIPLKNGETKNNNQQTFIVDYIEGPTSVRYATTGETDFNKNAYEIITRKFNSESNNFEIKKHGQNINTLSGYWRLLYFIENETYNNIINFLPSLTETRLDNNSNQYIRYTSSNQTEKFNNSPYLEPPGVYFKNTPLYGVQFVKIENGNYNNGIVLWTQPILSYQDNYPSTTLNKWNGKDILTDNDTGVIVANGLAAGKKEFDNTFTGVVIGDWSRTDTDKFITKQTGVYGFNHGAMSYALKDDGTAFFGKDGNGRIYFNGNKAQIYSSGWLNNSDKRNGMLIDIDDGDINIIKTAGYSIFSGNASDFNNLKNSLYYYPYYKQLSNNNDFNNQNYYYIPNCTYNSTDYGVEYKNNISGSLLSGNNNKGEVWNCNISTSGTDSNYSIVTRTEVDNLSHRPYIYTLSQPEVIQSNNESVTLKYYLNFDDDSSDIRYYLTEEQKQFFNNNWVFSIERNFFDNINEQISSNNNLVFRYSGSEYITESKTLELYLKVENTVLVEIEPEPEPEPEPVEPNPENGGEGEGEGENNNENPVEPVVPEPIEPQYEQQVIIEWLKTPVDFYIWKKRNINKVITYSNTSNNNSYMIIGYRKILGEEIQFNNNSFDGQKIPIFIADSNIQKVPSTNYVYNPNVIYYYYQNDSTNSNKYITIGASEQNYPLSIGLDKSAGQRKFKVNWEGQAFIKDGEFTGSVTAESGTIGNWKITSDGLTNKNGTVQLLTNGTIKGATIKGGTIEGSTISGGSVTGSTITATNGTIGGWRLSKAALTGSGTTLDSSQGIITKAIQITNCGVIGNWDNSSSHIGMRAGSGGYVACYPNGTVSIGDTKIQLFGTVWIGNETLDSYIRRIAGS